MSRCIVKVQLPIYSGEEIPHMLVYSKDRETINLFTPVQERFAKELKKFPHRGFYEATITGDIVDIGKRVKRQEW